MVLSRLTFLFPFFFLTKKERERGREHTFSSQQQQQQQQCSDNLQIERDKSVCVCTRVCVNTPCVWMMIFLKREFRESNLFVVVSEKIDPLKVLLSSLFFLSSVPQLGWRIFFASFGEERNLHFFHKKL